MTTNVPTERDENTGRPSDNPTLPSDDATALPVWLDLLDVGMQLLGTLEQLDLRWHFVDDRWTADEQAALIVDMNATFRRAVQENVHGVRVLQPCPSWCRSVHPVDERPEDRCHVSKRVQVGDLEVDVTQMATEPQAQVFLSSHGEDAAAITAAEARELGNALHEMATWIEANR